MGGVHGEELKHVMHANVQDEHADNMVDTEQ